MGEKTSDKIVSLKLIRGAKQQRKANRYVEDLTTNDLLWALRVITSELARRLGKGGK